VVEGERKKKKKLEVPGGDSVSANAGAGWVEGLVSREAWDHGEEQGVLGEWTALGRHRAPGGSHRSRTPRPLSPRRNARRSASAFDVPSVKMRAWLEAEGGQEHVTLDHYTQPQTT